MKVAKQSIARVVDQPDRATRFYLFCGPDESQSRALAARLLAALGAAKLAVSSGEVRANPALLADEAAALSLFGERRLIWIEPASNEIADGVEALLAAPSIESPVVAIAGALTKSSALLKLAEASRDAQAFTAYPPEGNDALRVVSELGRRYGLKISPPVAARLAESCANDQAIVAQELEKLALYVGASPHAPKDLELDAVDDVGADSNEEDILKLGDMALTGDIAGLSETVARLPAQGSEAIPAIRALQRRLLMLTPARARVERGERLDAVLASLGKSLFWKDKPAVERMLRTWTAHDLATVAERAGALERSFMFSPAPQREALGEELLAIARKARSAGR
ncbi:MAG TPA: DNA polymerase III subunit delta [Sphingomicrobium sp.]